jgi:hypothetical protein
MPEAEQQRLRDADENGVPWRRWGPYLSERQWGTVREDATRGPNSWSAFTHDEARSRAYRWGEDGLAGFSDDQQLLCLSLALWNGADPILKERLYGLTNSEGNHGEDVKEYYFYVDATPTSSYLKMLYKYPLREFPYGDLLATNGSRNRQEPEYELLDTGIFAEDRYVDVLVEYAKASPEDVLMQVTVTNRGPDAAEVRVLPTLWFRHTWSWAGGTEVPALRTQPGEEGVGVVAVEHSALGSRWCCVDGAPTVLMTNNETNDERIFGGTNSSPYVKDGIDRYVVHGDTGAVDPGGVGTKAAFDRTLRLAPGGSATVRLRLTPDDPAVIGPFVDFDAVFAARRAEADEFYDEVTAGVPDGGNRDVMRQALAGMLWSKQYYALDVDRWLVEHGADPLGVNADLRNSDWRHFRAADVISMPDKWEYPWFAAWDLAFHTVALSAVDIEFAKGQLELLLTRRYLHPNGQLSAYEWNFGDVNPPVHAWATWFVYQLERSRTGRADRAFLENSFLKLLKNFTWWLNRKDADGRNLFQGGFLGLDNVGVFDRSAPLPGGGHLDQADGTAWMALYGETMLQMALELAIDDPVYVEQAQSLLENLLWIAAATNHVGPDGVELWDEEDGFFYDLLRRPDGSAVPLKVRSVVGLMPLAAATVLDASIRTRFPEVIQGAFDFLGAHPAVSTALAGIRGDGAGPVLLALFDEKRLRRILATMLDEDEFLSPHGIRSVSKRHLEHPFVFVADGQESRVGYLPAESDSGMFGGNSNWRGPVWVPINAMLIRALLNLYVYFGDDFTVECPTGSGNLKTLYEVAGDLGDRLISTFRQGPDGRRPVHGGQHVLQTDPNWSFPLFYEYLHGDNGAGIGASHQTGWTGLVGVLPLIFGRRAAGDLLQGRAFGPATASDGAAPVAPAAGVDGVPDLAPDPVPATALDAAPAMAAAAGRLPK